MINNHRAIFAICVCFFVVPWGAPAVLAETPPPTREERVALQRLLLTSDYQTILDRYLEFYTIERLEKLAGQGDMSAAVVVGMAYDLGREVDEDSIKARSFFQQACDADEMRGCGALAEHYANGRSDSLEPDPAKAQKLLHRACDGGEFFSCYNLAYIYDVGFFGNTDKIKSRNLYKLSCDAGHSAGCNNLGVLYDNGETGFRDLRLAKNYFTLSCNLGYREGCENLKRLNNR